MECGDCGRYLERGTLRAPHVWLGEPDFCDHCGRPRDQEAAVWCTEGWLKLLVRLRERQTRNGMQETRGDNALEYRREHDVAATE